jgi:hypothetical protein
MSEVRPYRGKLGDQQLPDKKRPIIKSMGRYNTNESAAAAVKRAGSGWR